MTYHSYQVVSRGSATDYNGQVAQTYLVILGGTDEVEIKLQLEDLLNEGLS